MCLDGVCVHMCKTKHEHVQVYLHRCVHMCPAPTPLKAQLKLCLLQNPGYRVSPEEGRLRKGGDSSCESVCKGQREDTQHHEQQLRDPGSGNRG